MMKKIIAVLMALMMLVSAAALAEENAETTEDPVLVTVNGQELRESSEEYQIWQDILINDVGTDAEEYMPLIQQYALDYAIRYAAMEQKLTEMGKGVTEEEENAGIETVRAEWDDIVGQYMANLYGVGTDASDEDKANLQKEMEGYAQALEEGADPAKTIREAASQVPYSVLPVSAKALPHDIAEKLDSMSVGAQVGPFVHEHDNTINIVRLINKVSLPDSVEVRQIAAPGNDMAAIEKTADSIMNALAAGANFDTIAKKYDQPATKTWITSNQYEGQAVDENNRKFINTICTAAVGNYNKIVLDGQGVIIAQVTDRRNIINKYDVAVIKRAMDFSKDTYNKAFNDFSSFLAGNAKAEDIEANAAQAGYTVQTRNNVRSTEHNVVNVRSTREALRWIFDEKTKVGDVSPLYECGDNDHLLVITLAGVHKKGYLPWDDEQIRTYLTSEVMKDKKAAMLQEKMKGVKSVADVAKLEGAVTDTIKHITFMGNAFVSKIGASEPVLSGSVSKAKKGDFKSGIKGKAAIYAYQVLEQNKLDVKFDKKEEEQKLQQAISRNLGNFQGELLQKANITDKRYLFF